jgi:hypothetical protein
MKKPIYIIGDIHGKFANLKERIKQLDIHDCYLICVGDLGIGFQYDESRERYICELFNGFLEARDIEFMSIRGNHDDPKFFNDEFSNISLSHFKLLPDYYCTDINDQRFLFVGGAISIDRKIRIEGKSYWKNERFDLKDDLIQKCDVLITHSAPSWLGPFDKAGIINWCEKDEFLWRDCLNERDDHNILFSVAKPLYSYAGHFHQSVSLRYNGCSARILDELEIIEHR